MVVFQGEPLPLAADFEKTGGRLEAESGEASPTGYRFDIGDGKGRPIHGKIGVLAAGSSRSKLGFRAVMEAEKSTEEDEETATDLEVVAMTDDNRTNGEDEGVIPIEKDPNLDVEDEDLVRHPNLGFGSANLNENHGERLKSSFNMAEFLRLAQKMMPRTTDFPPTRARRQAYRSLLPASTMEKTTENDGLQRGRSPMTGTTVSDGLMMAETSQSAKRVAGNLIRDVDGGSEVALGEWQWPTITDFECLEITHNLQLILGGEDRTLYRLFDPPEPKLGWSSLLSGSLKIPRHSFILWLAILGKLPTTDKSWLSHLGIHRWIRFHWPNRDWATDIEWATRKWRGKHIINSAYRTLLASILIVDDVRQRILSVDLASSVSTRALYRLWQVALGSEDVDDDVEPNSAADLAHRLDGNSTDISIARADVSNDSDDSRAYVSSDAAADVISDAAADVISDAVADVIKDVGKKQLLDTTMAVNVECNMAKEKSFVAPVQTGLYVGNILLNAYPEPIIDDKIAHAFNHSSRKTLKFIAPTLQNGEVIVRPTLGTIRNGSKRWKTTAVGYFLGKRPYFHHLKEYALSVWPGLREVTGTTNGFFFFQFKSVADMEDIIEGGPWLFQGQPIVLQKWEPGIVLRKLKHTQIPVWIKLRHLPVELWTEEGLSIVANGVGKPLYPDAITRACTRLDFARVCVMLDVNSKVPKYIIIMTPDEEEGELPCKIDVVYEWLPPRCTSCMTMGHSAKECTINKPKSMQKFSH
ncbi:UNVERIFIED_CONTAM: hypothetical protein Sindi_1296100 [Sesamum indicum]